MVKLSESKGKSGESFARVFGNDQMGVLLSKVQSSVIRSGIELEQVLQDVVPEEIVTTLEELETITSDSSDQPPIQVVFKPYRPNPDNPRQAIQADLLIVDNVNRLFQLVEVKEGHVFDTKKADGELASLKSITSWLAQEFAYRATYYICAFNQEDKHEIVSGTKGRFTIDHVMTGRELCELIGIDYDELRELRKRDQMDNMKYFLSELMKIPEIRTEILNILSEEG